MAVIDIGSNSVRLVIYEGLTRAPTPIFNEKVLAGLGRQVQSTGLLAQDAMSKALAAMTRFRALCDTLHTEKIWTIATAACRDAENGPEFIAQARKICGTPIEVLSGKEEARLTALGVASSIYDADGIVGDLGGGSLELVDIKNMKVKSGLSLPLGGLALQDVSGKSLKRAEKLVKRSLSDVKMLRKGEDRSLYAVGGTWRALARLHMWQTGYPFHVMHNYRISAREALEFAQLVGQVDVDSLSEIDVVNSARRPLLPYAAVVLEHLIRRSEPKDVVMSVFGVREGLLFSTLRASEQRRDPLIEAAHGLNLLRSRSPKHGEELVEWTDRFMETSGLVETEYEQRLRHAACLLADIGWRAHPDYRGEQSLNIIAHGAFVSIDHPGRAYLAMAVFFRHMGLDGDELPQRLRELASTRLLDRARVLGAAMRVAYMITAGQSGVLPNAPLLVKRGKLVLELKGKLSALTGDRVANRVRALARLIGREPAIATN